MLPIMLVRTIAALLIPVIVSGSRPAVAQALSRPSPESKSSGVLAQAPSSGPRLTVIRDAETETLLRNFANPLFRAAGVDPNLVRIVLIRDNAINSFVSTGNLLFVNTGLIVKSETALEMVGVLAHETGHIAGGHLAKLPEAMRAAMIESLVAVLIGAAAGAAGRSGAGVGAGLGAQQIAQRNFLSFARGMEKSADQAAVGILDSLGWSARGMLELFHHLEDQQLLVSSLQDPYLLTHPLNRERVAFVQNHLDKSPHSNKPLPEGFETGFQMVRAKLKGFLTPSSVTLRTILETDRTPPARYARAIAYYRLGHLADALRLLDSLLVEQPANPWLHELKGQMLFENGRVGDSLPSYREAARLAPEQGLIRIGLAHAMVEVGDPILLRPAILQIQTALDRDRSNSDGWRTLGVAWGKLGDLGQANLALAEEAMLNGDIVTARQLASRAEKLLPSGPARLRAGDISNAVKKENRSGF